MKVAIIGNMNNNNFSLLRYLRDLNIEATLFLFKNDGDNFSSHFHFSSDTFEAEKWEDYIVKTKIINSRSQILGFNLFLNLYLFISHFILNIFSKNKIAKNTPSIMGIKGYVKKLFKGFDYTIGTGITPSLFYMCGIKLDIYAPYAFGLEFFDCFETKNLIHSSSFLKKYMYKKLKKIQFLGIKNSKIINTQFGVTLKTLMENKLSYFPLDYPMVYLSKKHLSLGEKKSSLTFNFCSEFDFVILSHSRHIWVKPDIINSEDWEVYENKHNNWLIESFADLKKLYPKKKMLLILLEYGRDVEKSKRLCEELNIANSVRWLPIMDRKDILCLINKVDVVASEFYTGEGVMWGGTGWETLIMGKSLILGFNFEKTSFEELFGFPPPPLFPVKTKNDLKLHLKKLIKSKKLVRENGEKNRVWFYKYNGHKIAKKWIDLLKT